MFEQGDFFPFLAIFAGVMTLPYLVLVASSFVKIAIVTMILRNALGIQQTPPNLVVYTIALSLTIFIMQPVAVAAFQAVEALGLTYNVLDDFILTAQVAAEPLIGFLGRNTGPENIAFFEEIQRNIAGEDATIAPSRESLTLLAPAFLLTELTHAFEMGFMLYLPFLAIDLVLTAILMAMGMNMVSPAVVAVPFKLLLFVALDGWPKLIQGLVLSYVQ